MSDDKHFTDRDAEQFAALTPKGSGKRPGGKKIDSAPEIRTRTSYTDSDLEKFQKMFSAGFAPEARREPDMPIKLTSGTSHENTANTAYSAQDEQQFGRLSSGGAERKASIKPDKGGRIEKRASAVLYSAQDLEQFEGLSAKASGLAKTGSEASNASTKTGASTDERRWRFPDLHETPNGKSSSDTSTTRLGQSSMKRPGEGRIKLRHFD